MIPLRELEFVVDVKGNFVERFSLFPTVGEATSAEAVRGTRRHFSTSRLKSYLKCLLTMLINMLQA